MPVYLNNCICDNILKAYLIGDIITHFKCVYFYVPNKKSHNM